MLKITTFLIFVCSITVSFSQSSKIHIQPKKNWAVDQSFDPSAKPAEGQDGGYYYLLIDDQENISSQENYIHYVYKILSHEGIQEMSDLSFEYDPTYQELVFHKVIIHREGTLINQLSLSKIRSIQREESMDRFLYDGSMTAIINLTDVRIGDIVEYSFTRKGYNPVSGGHVTRKMFIDYTVPYEKSVYRIVTPNTKPLEIKPYNTDIQPEIQKEDNTTSYTWSMGRVNSFIYDNHEPDWYDARRSVMISDFKNWHEVAVWAELLYKVSESNKKIVKDKIASKFDQSDPEKYAFQAIRFVQDEIRYLGFEAGLNSQKPHPPIKVYEQRFGDCKDKSLLLVTLLQVKGIKAFPVLLSTTWRDRIGERLPSPDVFNHCIVQFELNNRIVYIDPTINNQGGSLFNIYFPSYGKGLVIDNGTQGFIDFTSPVESTISENQTFDVTTIGAEALLTVRTTYTGGDADEQRSAFSKNTLESIQKNYLTFYGNLYSDIEKLKTITFDDNRNDNVFWVEESYKIPTFWKPNDSQEGQIYCEVYPQSMESYFNVSKSNQRSAPYSLAYPIDYYHHIHLKLPEEWSFKPDDQMIGHDSYEYEFQTLHSDHDVHVKTHYKTKKNHVAVEDFEKFVEDHQKMMTNLSFYLTYNKNLGSTSNSRWPGILTVLICLGFGSWLMILIYKNYDPQPYFPDLTAEPIGGWLILVGLGITFTPLRFLFGLIASPELLLGESWAALVSQRNFGLFLFVFLENIFNIFNLLFSVLILVLFYQRRSSLPRLITIFYAAGCMATILDTVVSLQINTGLSAEKNFYRDMIQSIVTAAIWIPYFNRSSRVRETFVNRFNDDQNG